MDTPTERPVTHERVGSGLWGHSHDPEHDLMKQYVIEQQVYSSKTGKPQGFLWVASYATLEEALSHPAKLDVIMSLRIWDQFNNEVVPIPTEV